MSCINGARLLEILLRAFNHGNAIMVLTFYVEFETKTSVDDLGKS